MHEAASTVNNRSSRYILLVDSKTNDLFYCSMLLQRFDYRVCTANTAGQALDMISVATPSLVIADLFLPGMGGVDLIRLLRQDPRTSSLPTILFVPAGDRAAERRCVDAGAACLPKPIRPEDLYRAVQAAVEDTPRSAIRIKTRLSVSVNNIPLDCIEGECASVLSEHGVYVRMFKPYDRNEQLVVKMNMGDRIIEAEATVLYSHRFGEGPFATPGMGLKFVRIAPEDREFIRQFIHNEVMGDIAP